MGALIALAIIFGLFYGTIDALYRYGCTAVLVTYALVIWTVWAVVFRA